MDDFKQYRRTQIAEMRPVTAQEIKHYWEWGFIEAEGRVTVSISDADIMNGSPKPGDMIARNPEDHNDKWLVSEQYFKDNFEEMPPTD